MQSLPDQISTLFPYTTLFRSKGKKNRIILILKDVALPQMNVRSCLNGILLQDRNNITDSLEGLTYVTNNKPTQSELEDLIFASRSEEHTSELQSRENLVCRLL